MLLIVERVKVAIKSIIIELLSAVTARIDKVVVTRLQSLLTIETVETRIKV